MEDQPDVAAKTVQDWWTGLTTERSQDWSGHIVLLQLQIVAATAVLTKVMVLHCSLTTLLSTCR